MGFFKIKKRISAKEKFKLACISYQLSAYEHCENDSTVKDSMKKITDDLINCTTVNEMYRIFNEISLYKGNLSQNYNTENRNVLNQYLSVMEQVTQFINDIESNQYSKIMIRFGFDKNNDLICFIANLNGFLSYKENDVYKSYVIGRDSIFNNNQSFENIVFMNWRLLRDNDYENNKRIKILNIRIKGGKLRLGWGSFALKSFEDVIIENINSMIEIYNNEITNCDERIGKINTIMGDCKKLSSFITDEELKNFYIKNQYTFYETNKFRKVLNYSKS